MSSAPATLPKTVVSTKVCITKYAIFYKILNIFLQSDQSNNERSQVDISLMNNIYNSVMAEHNNIHSETQEPLS